MYTHTVLEPRTKVFMPEYYNCPKCGERLERHIVCEGARFHVLSWFGRYGKFLKMTVETRCSCPNCEKNHRCKKEKE